jgi:hypothetical protein
MRSAQKIVPGENVINIPSRTQIKELDKNYEFSLLTLFIPFVFSQLLAQQSQAQAHLIKVYSL